MPKLNPRRVPFRRLQPAERRRSFEEIEQGYSLEEALAEAERCLRCPARPCVSACPAGNLIPDWIGALSEGRLEEAARIIHLRSVFPAICSRLCDQSQQCEGACVVGKRGDPVAIGRLERFVGDWEQATRPRARPPERRTGRRVAIVGAGPCGMAAAVSLAERGHEVHLFDELSAIGGVLAWGIPTFRLPEPVLWAETSRLLDLSVVFHGGVRLGADLGLDDLFMRDFQAVLLATGAPVPSPLGVPGEDLPGVLSSTEFLAGVKLRGERPAARRVLVFGGGNTAMDAAATAVRLGAEQVTIVYRRSRAELRARPEEIRSAEEEGIAFEFQAVPLAFLADEHGRLVGARCARTALGPRGAEGRATARLLAGSEFELPADLAVLALGFRPDPRLRAELRGVQLDERGYVVADPATGRTSRPGVWAGGDLVTGPSTVVGAMAWGLRAAADIDRFLAEASRPQSVASA